MKNLLYFLLITLVFSTKIPQQYTVNLDQDPTLRFAELTINKSAQIIKFLDYLAQDNLYATAFFLTSLFERYLKYFMNQEFYLQCKGIADILQRKVSQIIIFNYMYQFGAFHDFCTSISLKKQNGQSVLARNLDYGFQQFLANSSVTIVYKRQNKEIFRIAGHAGFIGTHTGMRHGKYAISLNQRIDGGFHNTLYSIYNGCHQVPYLLRKTFENCDDAQCAWNLLQSTEICAPVYFIIASVDGKNAVVERNRENIHEIFNSNQTQYKNFIVQTNTDRLLPDPDKRRITAQARLSQYNDPQEQDLFNVLQQYPNLNPLTLFTVVMNPSTGYFNTTIWY